MMIRGLSRSSAETRLWGNALGGVLIGKELILVHGGLGVGKTRFVQGLYAGLGGDPGDIVSPTFSLMNVHDLADGLRLLHYDLYRLEAVAGGRMPEIDDELGEAIQVVEWAQYLGPRYQKLPDAVTVILEFAGEENGQRNIFIQWRNLNAAGLAKEMKRLGLDVHSG